LFRFDPVPGADLATCLKNGTGLRDSVRRTELENLLLLPAGEHSPETAENFSSRRWDAVVREMQACGPGFIFVVDTAPVLATADAQYAVALADHALFVVRSEISPSKAVKLGVARLGQPEKTAIVFNALSSGETSTYYDYAKPAP
jgi:MinD-like ATPase involved in chromosome partitioning or flagellar assembly